MAEIFKHCHGDVSITNADIIFRKSDDIWKSSALREYSTKLTQCVGLVYLKPVVAKWRYKKARHQLLPVDFWTVGLIKNSFVNVRKFIAKYRMYFEYMIVHLCTIKLSHCDIKIRKLSSKSSYELVDLNVKYVINNILPMLINQSQFLFETHGALLYVAIILKRLIELKQKEKAKENTKEKGTTAIELSQDTPKALRNIIPNLEKNLGYRRRGGEDVRELLCAVICELSSIPNSIMILSNIIK